MERRLTQEINQDTGTVLKEWHRLNGRLHREADKGPSYFERDKDTGTIIKECYHWHGKLHREDGPARLSRNVDGVVVCEMYYRHGLLHRNPDEGPAWIERNDTGDVMTMEAYYLYDRAHRHPDVGPWVIASCEKTGKVESEQCLSLDKLFDPRRPAPRGPKPSSAALTVAK